MSFKRKQAQPQRANGKGKKAISESTVSSLRIGIRHAEIRTWTLSVQGQNRVLLMYFILLWKRDHSNFNVHVFHCNTPAWLGTRIAARYVNATKKGQTSNKIRSIKLPLGALNKLLKTQASCYLIPVDNKNSIFIPEQRKNRLNHFLKQQTFSAQGKNLWSNFFHQVWAITGILFCRCRSLSLSFSFCSSHMSSRHHATLSELLKVCQKLQFRKKAALHTLKIDSALSLYPSDAWFETLRSHQCGPRLSWYLKLDWKQRKMQKENICQTIFHLNTKRVDC